MLRKVSGPNDVPNGHHYAIIVFTSQSVHHEGDERSRTNPGHGYPAYTEQIATCDYFVSEDLEEARNKLQSLYNQKLDRTDVLFMEVNKKIPVQSRIAIDLNG